MSDDNLNRSGHSPKMPRITRSYSRDGSGGMAGRGGRGGGGRGLGGSGRGLGGSGRGLGGGGRGRGMGGSKGHMMRSQSFRRTSKAAGALDDFGGLVPGNAGGGSLRSLEAGGRGGGMNMRRAQSFRRTNSATAAGLADMQQEDAARARDSASSTASRPSLGRIQRGNSMNDAMAKASEVASVEDKRASATPSPALEEAVTTQPKQTLNPITPTSSMMPTSTRSFVVAKNFLEDDPELALAGGAGDASFNYGTDEAFDVTQQQYQQSLRKNNEISGSSHHSHYSGRSGGAAGDQEVNLFQQRDEYYNVDQSVNLMDTCAATYESRSRRKNKPGQSMVEIFLKENQGRNGSSASVASGTSSRHSPSWWFHPQRRANWRNMTFFQKLQDIFGRLLIPMGAFLLIGLVMAMVVFVQRSAYEDHGNNGGSASSSAGIATTKPPKTTKVPAVTDAPAAVVTEAPASPTDAEFTEEMKAVQTILLELDVSTIKVLKDMTSPAYKALEWVSEDDIALKAVPTAGRRQRGLKGTSRDLEQAQDAATDRLVQRYVLAVLYFTFHPKTDVRQDSSSGAGIVSNSAHDDINDIELHVKAPWSADALWLTPNSECNWHGVDCHFEKDAGVDTIQSEVDQDKAEALLRNRIRTLNLTAHNMEGTLPAQELQALSHLVVLDLRKNYLQGNMAKFGPHMHKWSNMEYLLLGGNHITGSIPETLSELNKLVSLDLSHNQLTGTLPMLLRLEPMVDLENFFLDHNQLVGRIPQNFLKDMPNIIALDLSDNQLSGELPYDLVHLSLLRELRARNNSLQGMIPPELQSLHHLGMIYIHVCLLSAAAGGLYFELTFQTSVLSFLRQNLWNWIITS
jgi:hypothetical protein